MSQSPWGPGGSLGNDYMSIFSPQSPASGNKFQNNLEHGRLKMTFTN